MNFFVNQKNFDIFIDNSNKISIKSYNKTYNVIYNNLTLSQIIKETYTSNDFIFMDRNVYAIDKLCLHDIESKYYFLFDAIEENKNINSVLVLSDILNTLNFNKKNKLIVIGGGITQDVGGFLAGIYKRGINWTFVPTTLLSMTDSAIGGKVCLNRNSKNVLGLFVAPNEIFISECFLLTLKENEIISGLGEALKLSLTGGQICYELFKQNYEVKNYINIIKMSSSVKKVIVEYDELEKNERKVLNYGHTFGHALESASNYEIPHGIAVLYGMYIINKLFYQDKHDSINDLIIDMIPSMFKNIHIPYDKFLSQILCDKKNDGNNICFILLEDVGKFIFVFRQLDEIEERLNAIYHALFL